MEGVKAYFDVILIEILMVSKFRDIFEDFLALPSDRIMEFAINLMPSIPPIPQLLIKWVQQR